MMGRRPPGPSGWKAGRCPGAARGRRDGTRAAARELRGAVGMGHWPLPGAAGCGQGCRAVAAAAGGGWAAGRAPRVAGATGVGRRPPGFVGVGPRLRRGRCRSGRTARRGHAARTAPSFPPSARHTGGAARAWCAAPLTPERNIPYKGRSSACFSIKCPRCRVLAMMSLTVAAGASGCERRYMISPVISTYMVSYTWSMQTSW